MARLYFNFETNVKDREGAFPNQVDAFTFLTKEGQYLCIECAWESNDGIIDNVMDGKWKGLTWQLLDKNYNELTEWSEEDNTKEFKNLLMGAEPVSFYMDEDALAENGYDATFIQTCKNIQISIEIGDEIFEFKAKELMELGELMANIKSQREDIER